MCLGRRWDENKRHPNKEHDRNVKNLTTKQVEFRP